MTRCLGNSVPRVTEAGKAESLNIQMTLKACLIERAYHSMPMTWLELIAEALH